MYAEERQEHILRAARSVGRVEVAELAAELDVAPETIRKDLTALERVGVVRRVHGGAIPVERLGFEPAVAARDVVLTAEKERIAKAAIAELPDEGAVLIDAGTTTARLAEALDQLDDAILQIRNYAFGSGDGDPAPLETGWSSR